VGSARRTLPIFDRGRIWRLAARFAERDRLADAAREYGKLVEIDPSDLPALHRKAGLELALGKTANAAETELAIVSALVSKGWKISALFRLKRLLGLLERARPSLRAPRADINRKMERLRTELAEQRPTVVSYDEAALALEKNRRDADAVSLLEKMTALEPDNPVFHARLAEALCRIDRIEAAIPVFRSAALVLVEFERHADAARVFERILYFRNTPEFALAAAALYLERDESSDAVRAIAKLQTCVTTDPENLDALSLLARAFEKMGQKSRAAQVRLEMARVAKDKGEMELFKDLIFELAPNEERTARRLGDSQSSPSVSARSSFVSVTDSDLMAIQKVLTDSRSSSSIVDELSFEEVSVLSEVWVMPVVTKDAQRALDEAAAFVKLRLYSKARYVLETAIGEDPVCAELRESLREVLRATNETVEYVEECVALADLYAQRQFFERARAVIGDALAADPENEDARALATRVEKESRGKKGAARS
jgi:tetratricopeptide (TPR) repeat protein